MVFLKSLLSTLVVVACIAAFPAQAGELRLRGAISVKGNDVTLGDLFDNAGGPESSLPISVLASRCGRFPH